MITVKFIRKTDNVEVQNGATIEVDFKVGRTGVGVVSGGTTGQALAKKSNTDYDTEWVTIPPIDPNTVIDANYATDKLRLANTSGTNTGDQTASDFDIKDLTDSTNKRAEWDAKQPAGSYEVTTNKGVNNGYAPLDSGGKVPLANLPSTLLKYIGQWDASTNTPTLTRPDIAKAGYVYDVSVSGTQFGINWVAGDWLIYNALGIPEISKDSDSVVSVNGQTGAVTLGSSDVGAAPTIHDHSGQSINPDNIVLTKAYTDIEAAALTVGTLFYNSDQLVWMQKIAVDVYHNFGEELPILSKNGDTATHLNGQAVYISSGTGQLNVLKLASSVTGKVNALATQDVLHTGNGRGIYTYFGMVRSFPYSNVIKSTDSEVNWVDGAVLYLCSEAGRYSTVKEAAPAKCSKVGTISNRNGANITVMFQPELAIGLSDLSDVDGTDTTILDTDELIKKDTAGLWKKITWANVKVLLNNIYGRLATTNTWQFLQTFTSGIKTGKIQPLTDSTTAVQITKADGTTAVVNVDTLNKEVLFYGSQRFIGNIGSANSFEIRNGNATGTIRAGADVNSNTLTNNVRKIMRITVPSYADITKQHQIFAADFWTPTDSEIHFGGNVGSTQLGCTKINFVTVYNNGDTGGVIGASIDKNGFLATTAKGGTTTDYGQLDANGIRLFGAATQYNDIDFPLIIKTIGVGAPTLATISGNVKGYTYAVNDGLDIDSTELNHAAKSGSTLSKFHVHIVTNGLDATDRYVRFNFEYLHANFGAVMAGTTVGAIDLLIPANTPDRTHLIFDIGDYTNLNAGSQIIGRFSRVAATGTAPTNAPFVLKFQLHSEFDKLGTNNITSD